MKKVNVKKIWLSLLMLCSVFVFTGCGQKDIDMAFSIGDARIKIDDTLQSMYDQGLVLCEVDGTVLKEEELPELKGKIVDTTSYCVGKKTDNESMAEPSDLYVYFYNTSMTGTPLKDCKIYKLWYNVPERVEEADVLVNGTNFAQLTVEETVTKLEEMGLSYEQDKKDDFLSAEDGYFLSAYTNNYRYKINSRSVVIYPSDEEMEKINKESRNEEGLTDDEKYEQLMNEAIERKVMITEFTLEKKLDLQYD